MKFAKYSQILTACSLALLLTACANQVSEINTEHNEAVKARVNLALAYLEQGNFPKAKANIDKAIAHNQLHYLPYSALGFYYQQTGDNENARQSYQTALKLSDNRPDVRNNYGAFLCREGDFTQAYQQFEQALHSNQPYYYEADTLENIVICAKQEGNEMKAVENLQKLAKLDEARAKKLH